MAKLSFQNPFEQWEVWEGADFIDDGRDGNFIHLKITTANKQIKIRMHEDEWNLFLHAMPKYKPRIEKEKIICSAIWYKELPTSTLLPKNISRGLVVCGHRHGHCINIVKMLSGLRTVQISPDGVGETVQGFLTDRNRFVDRNEAFDIAESANQLNDRGRGGSRCLYSEDLY